MRSEESIFQEASEKIQELSELRSGQFKFQDNIGIATTKINSDEKPLQDQVKTGEITPFQAIEKHKVKTEEG